MQLVVLKVALDIVTTTYSFGFKIAWEESATLDGWSTIGGGTTEEKG